MSITLICKYLYYIAITLQCCIEVTISIEVLSKTPRHVLDILAKTNLTKAQEAINASRRILYGNDVSIGRHFMVYLRLPPNNLKYEQFKTWLCGGAIVHDEYILTSAACIEDVKHFYVVSGTYRHANDNDDLENLCIKYGAKKAIWKCIPRNYVFDGHENDNLRWLNNDIAIVKVEDEFDFTRRVRGCDFIPKPVNYNNVSIQFEKPGSVASIAGWGSLNKYSEWISRRYRAQTESPRFPRLLKEASVTIITKSSCKHRWGSRYHNIIDNYMICTKDNEVDLSDLCQHTYTECKDILYDTNEEMDNVRRYASKKILGPNVNETRRTYRLPASGGFCENDHGGPLVYDKGQNAMVIGVISACLVKEKTNKCYGPFLYTSVYKNRKLINCAIYKDKDNLNECTKLFRAGDSYDEVDISWVGHPDGPSKSDVKKMRRLRQGLVANNETISANTNYANSRTHKVSNTTTQPLRIIKKDKPT